MVNRVLSVEGPDWAQEVQRAEQIVRTLEANSWDFNSAPDAFAREAGADVFAKELAIIFDGHSITRVGRLVLAGVGPMFNLMGPIHPQSIFRTSHGQLIDALNEQVGSRGVGDFPG